MTICLSLDDSRFNHTFSLMVKWSNTFYNEFENPQLGGWIDLTHGGATHCIQVEAIWRIKEFCRRIVKMVKVLWQPTSKFIIDIQDRSQVVLQVSTKLASNLWSQAYHAFEELGQRGLSKQERECDNQCSPLWFYTLHELCSWFNKLSCFAVVDPCFLSPEILG